MTVGVTKLVTSELVSGGTWPDGEILQLSFVGGISHKSHSRTVSL